MERTCTIFKPSGHKLAELTFTYDWNNWATVSVVEFRQLYDDNEDPSDESKSVYEASRYEQQHAPRQFASVAAIQAFDRDFASRELWLRHDHALANCRFEYSPDPVLLRYVVSHPRRVVGLCDVYFSFIDNTKRAIFRSAEHPRFDMELTADSLETNFSCMGRFSLYGEPVIHRGLDIAQLEAWY
jgi:hypothetical protein